MKIVTDYEVEGAWCPLKMETRCRKCGAILELVPKEGHYNSSYWDYAKNDGNVLKCCPNGCSVKDADKAQKEYSRISNYCTRGSTSYNWKLDLTSFRDCWINRNGVIFPVCSQGHEEYAEFVCRGKTQSALEDKGWVKISYGIDWDAICMKEFSKKQLDSIFDFCAANKIDTSLLYSDIDRGIINFKVTKDV